MAEIIKNIGPINGKPAVDLSSRKVLEEFIAMQTRGMSRAHAEGFVNMRAAGGPNNPSRSGRSRR